MLNDVLNKLRMFRMKDFWVLTGISAAAIVLTSVLYSLTSINRVYITVGMIMIYAAASLLYLFLSSKSLSDGKQIENDENFMQNIASGLLIKMSFPVLVAKQNGVALWCNDAFTSIHGSKKVTGVPFRECTGIDFDSLIANGSADTVLGGKDYNVICHQLHYKGRQYYVTLWDDNTDYYLSKKYIAEEDTIVAYVLIDNLDDISQYVKEGTRSAANEVEKLLTEWASSANGIIKEYKTNRYIFLFRAAELEIFEKNGFDILDKVREIRVGDDSLSLTLSIGISKISGSLSEKERAATEALEMALQRGGDQVAVKRETGLVYHGAKTQGAQTETKVRARVKANELIAHISKSSNVIIMGHRSPDFDCIGACIGVARIAAFCGVRFSIIANRADPNFKKCLDHISCVTDYREPDAIISASDAQELVGPDTLLVIVDVNNKTNIEAPSIFEICHRTVYIDHHIKAAEFDEKPQMDYIQPLASSTCELVAEFIEATLPRGELTKEEADVMYSGILLDTKQFTRNAGVRTFGAAVYLRGAGASPSEAQQFFKTALDEFVSEAKFESNVVIYKKVVAISYNEENITTDFGRISAAKAADKLLGVNNVKASFALCRIGDRIHISGRSNGEVNVQQILEKLDGGGHFDSAATQLISSISEAMTKLKEAIDECLTEDIIKN